VAGDNLSKAADNFEINRRIVFYNGFTGEYMLAIEGLCSRDNNSTSTKLAIVYHYRITFKPSVIASDIEVK